MGWRSVGQWSMSSSTNLGISERAAHSADRSRTCCSVGTSPVKSSQKRPAKRKRTSQQSFVSQTNRGRSKLTFGERLLATRGLREQLLAFRDGLATESDTFVGVENGALPDKRLDATGTTIDLVKSDLVDDLGAMLTVSGCVSMACARIDCKKLSLV